MVHGAGPAPKLGQNAAKALPLGQIVAELVNLVRFRLVCLGDRHYNSHASRECL